MKAKHLWLASVLVALSSITTGSVRAADDVVIHATSESCPSCEGGSKFHLGGKLFHRPSSCSACGDHAWLSWHPGQLIGEAHDCVSEDSRHWRLLPLPAPSFPKDKAAAAQQNLPQYLYNPYYRSPRDYFMSEH